jgi:hypothetical protein
MSDQFVAMTKERDDLAMKYSVGLIQDHNIYQEQLAAAQVDARQADQFTHKALDERDHYLRQLEAAQADNARLQAFAQAVMLSWPDHDVDGGDLQEIAERHSLIVPVEVTEPCSDNCPCAEVDSFPLTCYRKTPLLALPTDHAALDARLAQERERCAVAVETGIGHSWSEIAAAIRSMI